MVRQVGCIVLGMTLMACATNAPQLLSTTLAYHAPPSLNPTVAQPAPGNHYHTSVSWGEGPVLDLKTLGTELQTSTLLVGGGWYHQPDLTPEVGTGPFVGVDGALSFAHVDFVPSEYSASILDAEGISYRSGFQELGLEIYAKAGVTSRFYALSVSAYLLGLTKLETGDYFAFRRTNDGVAALYNTSADPVCWGFGGGVDFQLGMTQTFALGALVQPELVWNRTQTYRSSREVLSDPNDPYSERTAVVATKVGGVPWVTPNYRVEWYIDIFQFRLAAAQRLSGTTSLMAIVHF